MERMRVSAMRIVKKGQEKVPAPPARTKESALADRLSLRERMREAARKQEKKRQEAAAARPPVRTSGTGASRSPRTARAKQEPEQRRPWRYDFIVQVGVCAVILLSVVGFRAIDTPLTNQITDGISQVVTMDVDIGKDLGRLQFVRNIVPDSVLTFWESTSDQPAVFVSPFEGEIAVGFTDSSPGIVYTGSSQAVFSAADGTVDSISRAEDGSYAVKIRHDGGLDTVYGLLRGVKVAAGDSVKSGQEIALAMPGKAGNHLYFQTLRAGKAFDPVEILPQ